MSKDKNFTNSIRCRHCHNQTPMEVVADYSTLQEYEDLGSGLTWEAGSFYELLKCPACDKIILRNRFWHSGYMDETAEIEYEYLYPSDIKRPQGLPDKIESAYLAAQKVRIIDTNAYAVLLGRVLDLVCVDRNASGNTLDKKLKSLSDRGEIPEKLVNVSTGLRKLRNIGAHADL